MEDFEGVIFITPNVGEIHNGNRFLRNLNEDEIKLINNMCVFEYSKKFTSYSECIKDLIEKLKKIKSILEE